MKGYIVNLLEGMGLGILNNFKNPWIMIIHCGTIKQEVMYMSKKILAVLILLIILIPSAPITAKGSPCAEIFDPKQNCVVKAVPVNSEIYAMVTSWVQGIDNFYGKISPVTAEGYKVRIPLDPPIKVSKKSLNAVVSEVYIIVPQNKPPFFIIYEDKNKPSYFRFRGNIDSFSKALDFKLRN